MSYLTNTNDNDDDDDDGYFNPKRRKLRDNLL